MERSRRFREQAIISSPSHEIFSRVTHITRLHQLAEVEEMFGYEKEADKIRHTAVRRGMHIVRLAELNDKYQHALDKALEWLAGRDHEMHKLVKGTIEQAHAARQLMKRARRIAMNGNI